MKISRRGLFGTLIIHGLILALLILGGLTFPDPPPEEEGILVNFGTDDTGFGSIEPKGNDAGMTSFDQETPDETVEEQAEILPEQNPVIEDPAPADNTQDIEEVIVKEDPGPSPEEIQQQRQEEERIRKEQQEQERIKEELLERKLREEAAEKKRIEEERLKQAQQANRLNNLARNKFGQPGVGETEGTQQGETQGTGTNQGNVKGSPGAANYGDGSGLGNGTSYDLGSRKAVGELPLPNVDNCTVTSRIIVTVEIQVDRDGNVVSANIVKATFADNCIYKVVLEAARKTIFTKDQNASFRQTGSIKYIIEP